MSPAGNETYKRLIRKEHDRAGRSARYRFWNKVVTTDIWAWFLSCVLVLFPLIAFSFKHGTALVVLIFAIGLMFRMILGPIRKGGGLNLLRLRERAPLETSPYLTSARKKELPWRLLFALEAIFLTYILSDTSPENPHAYLAPVCTVVFALLLLEWFDHFRSSPRNNDAIIAPPQAGNPKLFKLFSTASQKFPNISWFDRAYRSTLTKRERIAAKALFRTSYDSPSYGILFGWFLTALVAFCIALPFVTRTKALVPLAVGMAVVGFPIISFILVRIRGTGRCGMRRGIVEHRAAVTAYFKLSAARWLFAWAPATAGIIFLLKSLGGDDIATNVMIIAAKLLLAAPGFACLGIIFRLAIPLTAKGNLVKTACLWLAGFCCMFPPMILMGSISKRMVELKSVEFLLWYSFSGSIIAGGLLLLHYLGWKRGWYDV